MLRCATRRSNISHSHTNGPRVVPVLGCFKLRTCLPRTTKLASSSATTLANSFDTASGCRSDKEMKGNMAPGQREERKHRRRSGKREKRSRRESWPYILGRHAQVIRCVQQHKGPGGDPYGKVALALNEKAAPGEGGTVVVGALDEHVDAAVGPHSQSGLERLATRREPTRVGERERGGGMGRESC